MTKRSILSFLHSAFLRLTVLTFFTLIFVVIAMTVVLTLPERSLGAALPILFAGILLIYIIVESSKGAAKQQQIVDLKSQFVMTVHTLKSPASSIRWALSTLMRDTKRFTPEEQEILARSLESITRFIYIVNDITLAAKLEEESNRHALKINIVSVLGAVIDGLYLELKQKNMHLSFSNEASEDVNVLADPGELSIIFSSLIDNAIRYSYPGHSVKVMVRKSGRRATVAVRDSGIGIPAADQKKIFAKFFRSTNAVAAEPHGTGLGLYIIREIVKNYDGRVWFESEEGKGTTFFVELPLAAK